MASANVSPTQKPIDERPFEHTTSRGVKFNIPRCDLDGILSITVPEGMSQETVLLELCEMLTWHQLNVAPELHNARSHYIKGISIEQI